MSSSPSNKRLVSPPYSRPETEIGLEKHEILGLVPCGIDDDGLHCPRCGRTEFPLAEYQAVCESCGYEAKDDVDLVSRANRWSREEAWAAVWEKGHGRSQPTSRGSAQTKGNDPSGGLGILRLLDHLYKQAEPSELIGEYLQLQGYAGEVPGCLRLHPAFPYFDEHGQLIDSFPTILAPIMLPEYRGVHGLHLTHLDASGPWLAQPRPQTWQTPETLEECPAQRVFPPDFWVYCASVPLAPAGEHLGVAIGLETALVIMQAVEMPVWMVVNEENMRSVEIPSEVTAVDLWTPDSLDLEGCWEAAEHLTEQGFVVRIMRPFAGVDWLAMRRRHGDRVLQHYVFEYPLAEFLADDARDSRHVHTFYPRLKESA